MVRLLGPVEIWAVEVGSPRQRLVLAALAVDAGRPVPVDVLVDRVFGQDPPPHARRTLHSYVARARRVLEGLASGGEPVRVTRHGGGYLLHLDPDEVDLHRFRRLVAEAGEPGCPAGRRAVLLREAVGLWRGQPLGGLTGDWAQRTRQAWQYERLAAAVAWADAELACGDPAAALGPTGALAAEHPLVESLTAVLMRLLAAVGRPAEALECYREARARLADELGVDPGPELEAAQRAVLRGEAVHPLWTHEVAGGGQDGRDGKRDKADGGQASRNGGQDDEGSPGRGRRWLTPAQLPHTLPDFTGREAELGRLGALLRDARAGNAVVIVAIAGTAGVGKTSLAVRWAHHIRDRFPDGQLYANLHGFAPTGTATDPGEVVRGFLDALGVAPEQIPAGLHAQAALYRSVLSGRRVLVVLDNARDADQVRPLLPGEPGSLVLVTSRSQLIGLVAANGARVLPVALFSTDDARRLFERRVGADRVAAEPDAVDQIIAACARLPLALSIAAARAITRPDLPLATLADELLDACGRLDALDGGDLASDVRAVFSWSYRALTPPAARMFRLLGLHPGPEVTLHAAASLAAVPPAEGRRYLAELVRTHLAAEISPGRFTVHDLLHEYAAELVAGREPAGEVHAARQRMLDHYLHTAYAADALLSPHRDDPVLPVPAGPGVTVPDLADHRSARTWFDAEYPVLLAVLRHAAALGFDTHAWQLAWTLTPFCARSGHWHDAADLQATALRSAERAADPRGQAVIRGCLAYACIRLGRYTEAEDQLATARDLFETLADAIGQAHAHRTLAWSLDRQGRYREALHHAFRALELFAHGGHRTGEARALNAVGWFQVRLGDGEAALASCQRALELQRKIDDRYGQADTLDSLGYVHQQLGDHGTAIACYREAIGLCREFGDRYNEAETLVSLGDAHREAGAPADARVAWRRALSILDDLGHRDAELVRARLREP